ncbi:MAG: ribulose-phosphate 3-epimerase [Patescibacteria group bacterium]
MKIIPAINEADFSKIKEKLEKAKEIGADWAQIDVADGKFTSHKTWNQPKDLSDAKGQLSDVNLELHLMVENPQEVIDDWIKAGAKRIIIHHEAAVDSAKKHLDNNETDVLNFILEKCEANGVELGLAINPETSAEELTPHLDKIRFIQILAVNPGLAGQQFQVSTLDKIKFIKELNDTYFGSIIVEVDGGINLEMAKLCKQAGADILAAASYIWNSENPKAAFEELNRI